MRALTLAQPWASLVARGAKRIETRSWRVDCEGFGWLAIHAAAPPWRKMDGKAMAKDDVSLALLGALGVGRYADLPALPFGAIVAVARPGRCLPVGKLQLDEVETPFKTSLVDGSSACHAWTERDLGDYRLGRWAWMLDGMQPLPDPVPARGRQGVWRVPDDVAAAVAAQTDLEPGEWS